MRLALMLVVGTLLALCGESLVMNGTRNITCANISDSADVRIEFRVHSYAAATGTIVPLNTSCLDLQIYAYANGEMEVFDRVANVLRRFASASRTDMLVRIQRNVTDSRLDVEVWDIDGNNYQLWSGTGLTYSTSYTTANGNLASFPTSGGNVQLAFFRAFTTLVPLGSRPPVTSEIGDYLDWKLDGNGNDASGNSRTVDVSGATFETTPGQVAVAVAKTANSPLWANYKPLRAGQPAQLDGSDSFSLADADDTVSCFWQQLPHADGEALTSQVVFDNRATCTPTLTGLVFGPYKFRLRVTDADGVTDTADLEAGAVAYDDNGVVIYPDDRLNVLMGSQMARGENPWEYADERQYGIALERANLLTVNGGTVEVPNLKTDVNGTPLAGTVWWNETTLDRTLYGVGTNFLEVFCGGFAGPANNDWIVPNIPTPTWGNSGGVPRPLAAYVKSCTSDTEIEVSVYLESEANVTVASPGVTWGIFWNIGGRPDLRTGTVYIANGSTTLNGTGTDFQNVWCGGGTTPASGSSVYLPNSPTMSLHTVTGCVSATEVTLGTAYTGTTVSSPGGAWLPNRASPAVGTWNTGGASMTQFYDTTLGYYREYYRSGDIRLRNAARYLALNQFRTPYHAAWTRLYEPVVSTILSAVVEPDIWGSMDPWPMITTRVSECTTAITQNSPSDQREGAYCVWAHALVALYHPDSDTRSTFRTHLVNHYNNQAVPFQLANGGYYSFYPARQETTRVWQAANGSDLMTLYSGSNIDNTYCGTASNTGGTATVNAEGTVLTGSGTSWTGTANKYIILVGTLSGQPHMEVSRIASSPTPTATSITLSFPWRGDSGAISFHIHNTGYPVQVFEAITSANALPTPRAIDLDSAYYCTYESGTQIRLHKPYTGDTSSGNVYRRVTSANDSYVFSSWFRQPFMDGLRASAYSMAATALEADEPATAAGYWDKVNDLVSLLYTGRDAVSNGQAYFADAPTCGPRDDTKANICNYEAAACQTERHYNSEGITGFARNYLETLNATDLSRGDEFYNWTYARPGYATPFSTDGCYNDFPAVGTTWAALGGNRDKALGQAFGHGGGSEWPAARVGGPAAVENRTLTVQVGSPLAYGDRIRVTATNASGVAVTNTCEAATCSVTSDFRAGGQSVLIEYLNASSAVLARATQNLIVN